MKKQIGIVVGLFLSAGIFAADHRKSAHATYKDSATRSLGEFLDLQHKRRRLGKHRLDERGRSIARDWIRKGADPAIRDGVLMRAALQEEDDELLQCLLDAGMDPNGSYKGFLKKACHPWERAYTASAAYRIYTAGGDVSPSAWSDKHDVGQTLIHFTCCDPEYLKEPEMLGFYIKTGLDVCARTHKKNNALHLLYNAPQSFDGEHYKLPKTEMLLSLGVPLDEPNENSQTPLDVLRNKHPELEQEVVALNERIQAARDALRPPLKDLIAEHLPLPPNDGIAQIIVNFSGSPVLILPDYVPVTSDVTIADDSAVGCRSRCSVQ